MIPLKRYTNFAWTHALRGFPARFGLALVIATTLSASCDDTTAIDPTSAEFFVISLSASKNPSDGFYEVECSYKVDFRPPESSVDPWMVSGFFEFAPPFWRLVAGESTWVDTLANLEEVTHRIRLERLVSEVVAIRVSLAAPSDTLVPPSEIRGSAVIFVDE